MSDFRNDENNNMNNNYEQGYGQENKGEYSYSYTPKSDAPKSKGRVGKIVFISVVTVIVIAGVILSGISIGTMVVKSLIPSLNNDGAIVNVDYNENEDEDTEAKTEANNSLQNTDGESVSSSDSNQKEEGQVILPNQQAPTLNGLTSAGQEYGIITRVYNAVSDSVVEITTEIVQNSLWMGQYVTTGAGSGVIIHEDGYIVTNNHVIEGATNVIVTLKNGKTYKATFIGTDASSDIAVIKIEADDEELAVATFGTSSSLVVGEDVIAIGNPLGSLGGTVTEGIISATERHMSVNGEDMVLLQTSAAINPGNSGGGLFNMAGQLIGIVNAKASGEDIEGLGFAIPVDIAHPIIEDLINYGYVRGIVSHGLSLIDVTEQNLAQYYYFYGITETGAIIKSSEYSTELQPGDKVLSVDGVEISSSKDIDVVLQDKKVGDAVEIVIKRGATKKTVSLTLREKVPDYVEFGS